MEEMRNRDNKEEKWWKELVFLGKVRPVLCGEEVIAGMEEREVDRLRGLEG